MLIDIRKDQRDELRMVLSSLEDEGKIEVTKNGRYKKSSSVLISGEYIANPRGFGFVRPAADEEDIFIQASNTKGAIHKDKVLVCLTGESGKRREGKIVRIIEHALTSAAGTFQKHKNFGFVVPDDHKIGFDIFVPAEHSLNAGNGDKVIVKLTSYDSKYSKNPEGHIIEILGEADDPAADVLSIVRAYDLPDEFPEKVKNQAVSVSKPVSVNDMAGRRDLRHLMTVTIDGEDAKDLDDAVTLEKHGDVYELGVHIADVSNYVQESSALDREALKRGTSVYLADRVLPMLPPELSNGICSLNQGEDRLALSCIMQIDKKGNITDHQISETVINVDRRMTYTDVNKIISLDDEETKEKYKEFVPMFFMMKELSGILRAKRNTRGGISFDFPESKVIFDENGRTADIVPYSRNAATKLIEDFMLAANETVAEDYFWREIPFLYRTHAAPDPERIRKLSAFINNFGYNIRGNKDDIHPKELQKLLESIEGKPEESLISGLVLRSMSKAGYSEKCTGHFGLAASYYCHFTSPIRRYPDLQIHRIIKDDLRERLNERKIRHYDAILPDIAAKTSSLERRADEAERETVKLKKAEYMKDRIGQTFEGIISGITDYGIYVELPNTVEGMIRVSDIPGDYFNFIQDRNEMVGEHTGKTYRPGQKVSVIVSGADTLTRTVDFKFSEEK